MYFSTLPEWLSWVESIHNEEIALGLDRVKVVAERLKLLSPSAIVMTVGGTNGKGSTVAGLESIYLAAGYRVGTFTSPILFKHNEQVHVNGKEVEDREFCLAFEKIEAVRGDVPLTSFEFCTLAAFCIFQQYPLDVIILEVGLGGRLDAVNSLDAEVAVVTSISIDHVSWLGPTRESIAYEKAGIFRSAKPAICGDMDPPKTLIEHATKLGAPFFCQGKDFFYRITDTNWSWQYRDNHYENLPLNSLALQNMSTVLMAVTLLQDRLPVTRAAIEKGLSSVKLPGRIQIMEGPVTEIYDVSHNPASITLLSDRMKEISNKGKTFAVFSMLADKDIAESIKAIRDKIDAWHMAPLATPRAATKELLLQAFQDAGVNAPMVFSTIEEAYRCALSNAQAGDCIVIFGSFHTVAEAWNTKNL